MRVVKGDHIVVIGAARSGLAAACLLKERGANVFVTDSGEISESAKKRLAENEIRWEENGHSESSKTADYAVVSPGVPDESPLIQFYQQQGKSVYSEIEIASWFTEQSIFAVTGSNGKTTTASWMAYTWQKAERDMILAGNIGSAFSDHVSKLNPQTDVILEVSSFQLDHIDTFKPSVSMLLNITPDHLNRYQNDFSKYTASKLRIKENQTEGDTFIYWDEDPVVATKIEIEKSNSPVRYLSFSDSKEVDEGVFVREGKIYFKLNQKEEFLMYVHEMGLPGRHNLKNGMATALAARVAEIKNETIRESLMTFEGVAHRLEHVRTLNGVQWYNDSKATNVNAVWYALQSFSGPLVLIMGGRDKGNDYSDLIPELREKVHTLIAIGEGKAAIEKQLRDEVPNFVTVQSMGQAVDCAHKWAKRGEVVLLSPACASFDMFESYEHRGDVFKYAVNKLVG